jgi:hypothetical protein
MVLEKNGRLLWTGRERSPLDTQWYLSSTIVPVFKLSVNYISTLAQYHFKVNKLKGKE